MCQAKDQSIVFRHVIGGLELKVHHVLQVISVWVDEDPNGDHLKYMVHLELDRKSVV